LITTKYRLAQGGIVKPSEIIQSCPIEVGDTYLAHIITPFGTTDGKNGFHHGIDMLVNHNGKQHLGPVISCFDFGIIVFADHYNDAGKTIIIMDLKSSTRLQRVVACYCHLNEIYSNVGDIVVKKERIAYMGGTGITTNQYREHLHFSLNILEKNIPITKAISGYGARNPFDFGLQNFPFSYQKTDIEQYITI